MSIIIAVLVVLLIVQQVNLTNKGRYKLTGFYGGKYEGSTSPLDVYLTFGWENKYKIMTPEGAVEEGSYKIMYEKDGVFYVQLVKKSDATIKAIVVNRNEVFLSGISIYSRTEHILTKLSDEPTYINTKPD